MAVEADKPFWKKLLTGESPWSIPSVVMAIVVGVVVGYLSRQEPTPVNNTQVTNIWNADTPTGKAGHAQKDPGGKVAGKEAGEKHEAAAAVVNIQYDVGLAVHHNGAPYRALATPLAEWLKPGNGNAAAVQPVSVPLPELQGLFEGDVSALTDLRQVQLGRYLCVLRLTSQSAASTVAGGLTRVDCNYDLVVIESRSGRTVFIRQKQISASDISAADAQRRVDEKFIEYLHTETIALR